MSVEFVLVDICELGSVLGMFVPVCDRPNVPRLVSSIVEPVLGCELESCPAWARSCPALPGISLVGLL